MGSDFCECDMIFEELFSCPEKYIYGEDELGRFRAYRQQLAKESDIQMVWECYSNYFFPFNLNPYIDAMEKMLPDKTVEFMKYCNRLDAPAILHEIFAACRRKYGNDILTRVLGEAPVCVKKDESGNMIWDGSSFAAPTALDSSFLALTLDFPLGGKIDESNIEKWSRKIGQSLLSRPDGYFLVWNYIKYLLSKDIRNPDVTWLFIKTIGETCEPILDGYHGGEDWLKSLRPRGFHLDMNRGHFSKTGILGHSTKESMYLNLLAQMQFNQKDGLDSYLPCFEDSLLIEDEMFRAFDSKPSLHHYYIAEIYLASDDPLEKWLKTWEKMQSGRYRVWFNRYDATSAAIVKNLNFLLLVGIALMEGIYSSNPEDKEREKKGLQFCEKLWDLLKDMTIKRERNVSQIHNEMIYYLAAWRFLFIKKIHGEEMAMNQMTEFLIRESLSPRVFLNVLRILLNNGFTSLQYISYKNQKVFQQKLLWNTQHAIDLTPSEDSFGLLGKHIKSQFKLGGNMNYRTITFPKNSLFLVTGGAGFIGSNLCEAILSMGHRVRVLDNLSTGYAKNIAGFRQNPNFEFIEGDIRDTALCMRVCEGVDYVLHQAAAVSVPESIEQPVEYTLTNIVGTVNMMEAAAKSGVKKFTYASSAAVYGDDETMPKREEIVGNRLSTYAVTKFVAEEYAYQYTMHYGLDCYGMRYFNVYGRRQDPNGAYAAVIPKFIECLLRDEPPTINGDGEQSRDFVYVEDVVQANLLACVAPHEAAGEAYNVAAGKRSSLNEMYAVLSALFEKDLKPVFGPERKGDIRHSGADISKICKNLGYAPEYDFAKGIKEAIQWYKENL